MAFTHEIKHGFAHFEKYFYLPALPVNADDLLFRKFRICTDKRNPIFTAFLVANADNLSRDVYTILFYRYINREKILTSASTFFIHSINFVEVQFFSIIDVTNLRRFTYQSNSIKTKLFLCR